MYSLSWSPFGRVYSESASLADMDRPKISSAYVFPLEYVLYVSAATYKALGVRLYRRWFSYACGVSRGNPGLLSPADHAWRWMDGGRKGVHHCSGRGPSRHFRRADRRQEHAIAAQSGTRASFRSNIHEAHFPTQFPARVVNVIRQQTTSVAMSVLWRSISVYPQWTSLIWETYSFKKAPLMHVVSRF